MGTGQKSGLQLPSAAPNSAAPHLPAASTVQVQMPIGGTCAWDLSV